MRLALILAAVAWWTGCSAPHETLLGGPIAGQPTTVADIQKASPDSPVVLTGTITRKCPVAGCWFTLHDPSGDIHVDTKNAGFVVLDVPLNRKLIVAGRVASNGASRSIEATGLRY
jgi:uncharacterized protein YdeI (BOF family)